MTGSRIEAATEDRLHANLTVEEIEDEAETAGDDRETSTRYEITKGERTSDDEPSADRAAVCVEVTTRQRGQRSGVSRSYAAASSGRCTP